MHVSLCPKVEFRILYTPCNACTQKALTRVSDFGFPLPCITHFSHISIPSVFRPYNFLVSSLFFSFNGYGITCIFDVRYCFIDVLCLGFFPYCCDKIPWNILLDRERIHNPRLWVIAGKSGTGTWSSWLYDIISRAERDKKVHYVSVQFAFCTLMSHDLREMWQP